MILLFKFQASPLTSDGRLTVCVINDLPYVVLLSDVLSGNFYFFALLFLAKILAYIFTFLLFHC